MPLLTLFCIGILHLNPLWIPYYVKTFWNKFQTRMSQPTTATSIIRFPFYFCRFDIRPFFGLFKLGFVACFPEIFGLFFHHRFRQRSFKTTLALASLNLLRRWLLSSLGRSPFFFWELCLSFYNDYVLTNLAFKSAHFYWLFSSFDFREKKPLIRVDSACPERRSRFIDQTGICPGN